MRIKKKRFVSHYTCTKVLILRGKLHSSTICKLFWFYIVCHFCLFDKAINHLELLVKWVQNLGHFLMSRKYLIFHIKSFREGSVQHFNNIFEFENKQRKDIVVIASLKKRKISAQLCLGPILSHSRSLTLRDIIKLSFRLKFERFLSKNGKQTSVEELLFKMIVTPTITIVIDSSKYNWPSCSLILITIDIIKYHYTPSNKWTHLHKVMKYIITLIRGRKTHCFNGPYL